MIVRTLIAALVFGAAAHCQTGLAQQTNSIFAQRRPTNSLRRDSLNLYPSKDTQTYVRQLAQYQRSQQVAQRAYQQRFSAVRQAGYSSQNRGYGYGNGYNPYYGGNVGYQPNIVWLPSGTSLNTAATVLPNGRVRVTAQPFFSSVPAVHTYNLRTGQVQRIR
jgi:hypothetical protein